METKLTAPKYTRKYVATIAGLPPGNLTLSAAKVRIGLSKLDASRLSEAVRYGNVENYICESSTHKEGRLHIIPETLQDFGNPEIIALKRRLIMLRDAPTLITAEIKAEAAKPFRHGVLLGHVPLAPSAVVAKVTAVEAVSPEAVFFESEDFEQQLIVCGKLLATATGRLQSLLTTYRAGPAAAA